MRRGAALACLLLGLLPGCGPPLSGTISLQVERRSMVAADSAEELVELLLRAPGGDSVVAYLRQPIASRRAGRALPAIVLLAGRETGRQAAGVIPGPLNGMVLAIEYPAEIPPIAPSLDALDQIAAIRRSAYRVPGIVRGAGELLAAWPGVDPRRLGLVGVSFGVPFAAAAAPDPVFRFVALHHGGADLALLFRANLPIEPPWLRGLIARFAACYFRQLEPARHVRHISPRPLLLINGLHDEKVPRESGLLLAATARPPVRQIWLPHDHLMPGDYDVMRELADSTWSQVEALGR